MESMANLIEYGLLYGNDVDSYQFNGIDTILSEDSVAQDLIANGGNYLNVDGSFTLTHMDQMLDATEFFRGAVSDPKIFMASNQMISRISGLQTRISREVQTIEFEGGFRMATYRGVPIYPTQYVRPQGAGASPTDLTATKAAGGSLADDQYFYRVSSVTNFGEQIVGNEDSDTTETTNNSVDLAWTADPDAKLYKIWRGTVTGVDNMSLLTTIAAKTYDASGAVTGDVATFTDDGTLTPVTSIQPLDSTEEQVMLINLNPDRGVKMIGNLSPLGEQVDNFISYVPLATRKSALEYLIESFMAMQAPYPRVHAIARRAIAA